MMDLTIRPLTAEQWPALEDLFGKAGASNGCWCMYWRIGPRYRSRSRADNKEDLARLAAAAAGAAGPAGAAEPTRAAPGLLAFDGGVAVGWCELAPRADLGWLARTRYLQPPDDLPVWSVPCFYVRRTHRGRGVTDALVAAAISAAATAGAPALEAYPVDIAVPGHTRNLFPGIASTFARHGFQVVARHKPDRPVMRRPLTASAGPDVAAAGSR
jgi:GNAT superfamily N-acetyltransferase